MTERAIQETSRARVRFPVKETVSKGELPIVCLALNGDRGTHPKGSCRSKVVSGEENGVRNQYSPSL
jgi:hypothetical protein